MMDFITTIFMNALLFIYQLLGNNFGLAIIVLTVLIRLLTYPFNQQQMKSAAAMQEMQNDPKWQKIQKKYANDKEKLAQEQMKVYQEKGINPFGSCLPTLIQFPIIIGLYGSVTRALAATPIQLLSLVQDISLPNAASLLPLNSTFLWIADLAQPERLPVSFIPESWPLIGGGLPILAIVVIFTSYFQTKAMSPTSTNPNDQSAAMTKMMAIYMPLLMGWISYSYSAGLALYFVTSNVASLIQYALMGKIDLKNLLPKKSKG